MVVKVCYWNDGYERLIECDTVHKLHNKEQLNIDLQKDGKLVENISAEKESVQIFIMEKGKTVDKIDFNLPHE